MKFVAEQKALASALAVAGRVAARNDIVPILSSVLVEADAAGVRITADNGDLRFATMIEAEVELAGRAAVPGQILSSMIKGCRAGVVTMSHADRKLSIRAGSARFSIATLDASLFNSNWETSRPHAFELPEAELTEALRACSHSISSDRTRAFLNGVYLGPARDRFDMVATDGHTMTIVELPPSEVPDGMEGIILPDSTVAEIVKLAGDGVAQVAASDRTVEIRFSSGTAIVSKVIEGTYPDYRRIAPVNNDKIVLADRAAMSDCLSRVAVVAADRGRTVKFAFSPSRTIVSALYNEGGASREASDSFDVDTESEIEIAFNATYVRDTLDAFDSEMVELRLHEPHSPGVFVPQGKTSPLCIIMPLRA